MPDSTPPNRRILVIDDNDAIHEDIRKVLGIADGATAFDALDAAIFGHPGPGGTHAAGPTAVYEIDSACQGQEGLEMVVRARAAGRPYAMAFVDMRMPPGWDGVETIEKLWEADPELQAVICTAFTDYSRDEIVQRLGVTHRLLILKKPFDTAEVAQLACALTEKWRSARQASLKFVELERMVEARTADLCWANERLTGEIAERERVAAALGRSEERYALAARGANDGLWDWDLAAGTVYFSPRFKSMLGDQDQGFGTGPEAWLGRVHTHDSHAVRAAIDAHLAGTTTHLEVEHRLVLRGGQYRWFLCRGVAVRGADGKPVRIAGSLSDIHTRKEAEEELRRGFFYDRLTELPNRALLQDCITRAINVASAQGGCRFAVLFLDFDRFKLVNDSHGHHVGDQLLVAIARRLVAALGVQQDAGRTHTVGRFAGDEYLILVEGISTPEEAVGVAEQILRVIAEPFRLGTVEVFCNASIGIAMGGGSTAGAEEVLAAADVAMYHAKAAGKGRYALFDASMRDRAVMRMRLETDLRRAIERGELLLHYQPIVALDSRGVAGFEALVRWRHPVDGLIGPDKFIPIAEETGLIVEMGLWVIEKACHQMHAWRGSIPDLGKCSISVNLSRKQFVQGNLVEDTKRVLLQSGLPPEALVLEVTESTIMEDLDSSISILKRLGDFGVRVHMDDFGTGYSSLSCLRRLPIQGLKIDRSFISQIASTKENPAIVHAVVTLARNLKMTVTAEGVEDSGIVALLQALDCDLAQGYHFSRPIPAADIPGWLARFSSIESRSAA